MEKSSKKEEMELKESILPGQTGSIFLDIPVPERGKMLPENILLLKTGNAPCCSGKCAGFDEILLKTKRW